MKVISSLIETTSLLINKNTRYPVCLKQLPKGVAIKNAVLHLLTPSVKPENLGVGVWNLDICVLMKFSKRPLCL